jgi:hypothetical protein
LHFQVQTTPYIGSKTFAYPLSYFVSENNGKEAVQEFSIPSETAIVSNINHNTTLKQAFEFLPGFNLTVTADGMEEGKWEVFTDAYNNSYFYCHTTKSLAYFKRNETVFYFTSFDGDKSSLLYHFYIACYKVYLATEPAVEASDKFPLQLSKNTLAKWLQDFIAPFVSISTKQVLQFLSFRKIINESVIDVKDNRINAFSFIQNKKEIKVICTPRDY